MQGLKLNLQPRMFLCWLTCIIAHLHYNYYVEETYRRRNLSERTLLYIYLPWRA